MIDLCISIHLYNKRKKNKSIIIYRARAHFKSWTKKSPIVWIKVSQKKEAPNHYDPFVNCTHTFAQLHTCDRHSRRIKKTIWFFFSSSHATQCRRRVHSTQKVRSQCDINPHRILPITKETLAVKVKSSSAHTLTVYTWEKDIFTVTAIFFFVWSPAQQCKCINYIRFYTEYVYVGNHLMMSAIIFKGLSGWFDRKIDDNDTF